MVTELGTLVQTLDNCHEILPGDFLQERGSSTLPSRIDEHQHENIFTRNASSIEKLPNAVQNNIVV